MKNFKKFCINTVCPTNCQSIRIIGSAKRYCYDENYHLPQNQNQIRYKKNGITNIVATGIIDHPTHSGNESNGDTEKYEWEINCIATGAIVQRDFTYARKVQQVCEIMKIPYNDFVRHLKEEFEEEIIL